MNMKMALVAPIVIMVPIARSLNPLFFETPLPGLEADPSTNKIKIKNDQCKGSNAPGQCYPKCLLAGHQLPRWRTGPDEGSSVSTAPRSKVIRNIGKKFFYVLNGMGAAPAIVLSLQKCEMHLRAPPTALVKNHIKKMGE